MSENEQVLTRIALEPLRSISPSQYHSLKSCELRGILTGNHRAPLMPISPAARVGQIIHKLLEMVALGQITDEKSMQSAWEEALEEVEQQMKENPMERHLVPLEHSANGFETKKKLLFAMIKKLEKSRGETRKIAKIPAIESEAWYESEDGKVRGKIDLVRYTDSGAEIIDYKTDPKEYGSDESLRPEYQDQLKMYAAIFHSKKHEWPIRLVLVGINQKEYEVKFGENECARLLNDATSDLDKINQKIAAGTTPEEFAKPSPESCRYCPFRPACAAYWKSRRDTADWPSDVSGEVIENELLGNGLRRIVIASGETKVAIRSLSPDRYGFLDRRVKKVVFCNLIPDKTENSYAESPLTVGFDNEKDAV